MNHLRAWLRSRGAGRLAYRWLHRPRREIDLASRYGWRLAWDAWRGERAMRQSAFRLQASRPDARGGGSDLTVCLLTGPDFVHQTLFCAHSFQRHANRSVSFEFLSDGRLRPQDRDALTASFPSATVRDASELDAAVRSALPPAQFPCLHEVRRHFVLLRKLTDAMAGRSGYRLFLDSDMLFWTEPRELLERAERAQPLYLADLSDDGYTAGRAEITGALGVPVAPGVNSGVIGIDAASLDWQLMERACRYLIKSPGDQRLLEQTLWAVALGGIQAHRLNARDYRVVINPTQWRQLVAEACGPALVHYAWHARWPYSAYEWRRYLLSSGT